MTTAFRSRKSIGSASAPVRDQDQLEYSNLSCLGEFLLGYPNEYGALYDRAAARSAARPGCAAAAGRRRAGAGRPRTQRLLSRDAPATARRTTVLAASSTGKRKAMRTCATGWRPRWWAAQNKWRTSGSAGRGELTPSPTSADPQGLRCPLGAHIRRANPRNADLPPGPPGILSCLWRILGFNAAALEQDLVASTRFHRLLRRGRKYGAACPALSLDGSLAQRRYRAPFHLPCGQYHAPVRVRAERVVDGEQICRAHRRKRSIARPPIAATWEGSPPTASRFRKPMVRIAA